MTLFFNLNHFIFNFLTIIHLFYLQLEGGPNVCTEGISDNSVRGYYYHIIIRQHMFYELGRA